MYKGLTTAPGGGHLVYNQSRLSHKKNDSLAGK